MRSGLREWCQILRDNVGVDANLRMQVLVIFVDMVWSSTWHRSCQPTRTDRRPQHLNAAEEPTAMRRLRSSRCASNGGFTLVEMVMVMVVIGIMVAMVAPKLDVTRYQVESAMQGIGTTLLAAQRLAVTRQYDVIVSFDVANNQLLIHEDANNDGVVGATEHVRKVLLGDKVVFGLGAAPARPMGAGPVTFVKNVGGLKAVVFHRGGSSSEQGGFYMTSQRAATLGGYASDTRAVEIERATGRATWWRYSAPSWIRGF